MPRYLQNTGATWLCLSLCLAIVGCLSFSLEIGGRRNHPATDPVLCQTGKIKLQSGDCLTIYYPVAYHTPPHLEVESDWTLGSKHFVVGRQGRDHFQIHIVGEVPHFGKNLRWTARGLPVTVPLPGPPVVVVPPPVPVEGPPGVPSAPDVPNPLPPLAP